MTRNLKVLGLAVFAVLALGALTAQGAAAEKAQEFHSDGEWTVGTGAGAVEFAIGTKGVVKCSKAEYEDESQAVELKASTYTADQLTVTARFLECTFGGMAATVNTQHCAFILDSDTTAGNPTGGELANVEIECASEQQITIATSQCTVTVGPQLVKHAIEYQSDTATSINGIIAAHEVVVSNLNDKAGCVLFPKGKVGKATGNGTTECFQDEGEWLTGTSKTTPKGVTKEGKSTECSIQ